MSGRSNIKGEFSLCLTGFEYIVDASRRYHRPVKCDGVQWLCCDFGFGYANVYCHVASRVSTLTFSVLAIVSGQVSCESIIESVATKSNVRGNVTYSDSVSFRIKEK